MVKNGINNFCINIINCFFALLRNYISFLSGFIIFLVKAMVISDTHNDVTYLPMALSEFRDGSFDKLYVLGDIGASSARLFNEFAEKITAVKGNNDFYSVEEICNFPLPYINYSSLNGKRIVLTHGHYYNEYNVTGRYDILLLGHTHRSMIKVQGERLIMNPGSIGLPRDSRHSYMTIDEKEVLIKDIVTGGVINKLTF